MTSDEFHKLTKEEVLNISDEEFLKYLIRFTEERYISYKNMLSDIFKDNENFPLTDEFTIWYKDDLRESKNREEGCLKDLRLEIEHFRQGLNSPYLYPKYNKTN
jgi:hypothetical protein